MTNLTYEEHLRAKPGNQYSRTTTTWHTQTGLLTYKRNQNLCGEASYLVTEARGNDIYNAVPWRVKITRNFYDDQSFAVVYRWSSSHLAGGTYGRWEEVTVEDICNLPIHNHSYITDDSKWEADMNSSLDRTLHAGLVTLGLE